MYFLYKKNNWLCNYKYYLVYKVKFCKNAIIIFLLYYNNKTKKQKFFFKCIKNTGVSYEFNSL